MGVASKRARKVALPALLNFLPGPNWFNSRAVATTKSGKVAMGSSCSVCLFDADRCSFEAIWYLPHYAMNVRCSKSSEQIMIAGDQGFTIVEDDKVLFEHRLAGLPKNAKITAADWSESQKCVIFGNESGSIFVQKLDSLDQKPMEFNLVRPKVHQQQPPDDGPLVTCIEICPHAEHEKLVAIGFKNGTVCMFRWDDGNRAFLKEHSQEINCLAWSPKLEPNMVVSNHSGQKLPDTILLASSGNEGYVNFWRVNLDDSERSVLTHRMSPPKERRFNTAEKRFFPLLWPEQTPYQVVTASYNNELITIQLDQKPRRHLDLATTSWQYGHNLDQKVERGPPVLRKPIFGINFAGKPGNQLVVTNSWDNAIRVWDWTFAKEIRSCKATSQMLNAACVGLDPKSAENGSILVSFHVKIFHLLLYKLNSSTSPSAEETPAVFEHKLAKVTAIAWDPSKPATFAVGLSDGQIGIMVNINGKSDKPILGPKPLNPRSVWYIQYGPRFAGLAENQQLLVYALIGKEIFVFTPTKMKETPLALSSALVSPDPLFSTEAAIYSFHWFLPPDLSGLLAVGYDKGCIRIFKPIGDKLVHTLTLQTSADGDVTELAWHSSELFLAAFSVHKKNAVEVFSLEKYDLKSATGTELPAVVKPISEFGLQKDRISCLSWLPSSKDHQLLLATGSAKAYTIQVYDVLKKLPVCNYRSHGAPIRFIAPSPLNSDEIFSASEDGCTFCWRWADQPDKMPPEPVAEEEVPEANAAPARDSSCDAAQSDGIPASTPAVASSSAAASSTPQSGQMAAVGNGPTAAVAAVNGSAANDETSDGWGAPLSHEAKAEGGFSPKSQAKLRVLQRDAFAKDGHGLGQAAASMSTTTAVGNAENQQLAAAAATAAMPSEEQDEVSKDFIEMESKQLLAPKETTTKRRKVGKRSLFEHAMAVAKPEAAGAKDQLLRRDLEFILDNLPSNEPNSSSSLDGVGSYLSAAASFPEAGGEEDNPGAKVPSHLSIFLADQRSAFSAINAEAEHHKTAGSMDAACALNLFAGRQYDIILSAIQAKELNDYIVSLACSGGYELWRQACVAYAEQLVASAQFQKAASYYLAIGEPTRAIELLSEKGCHVDAIMLARARLPSNHELLQKVQRGYLERLITDANYEPAAKCALGLGDLKEAISLLKRRTADLSALGVAFKIALKLGEAEQITDTGKELMLKLILQGEWKEAHEFIDLAPGAMKVWRFIVSAHEAFVFHFRGPLAISRSTTHSLFGTTPKFTKLMDQFQGSKRDFVHNLWHVWTSLDSIQLDYDAAFAADFTLTAEACLPQGIARNFAEKTPEVAVALASALVWLPLDVTKFLVHFNKLTALLLDDASDVAKELINSLFSTTLSDVTFDTACCRVAGNLPSLPKAEYATASRLLLRLHAFDLKSKNAGCGVCKQVNAPGGSLLSVCAQVLDPDGSRAAAADKLITATKPNGTVDDDENWETDTDENDKSAAKPVSSVNGTSRAAANEESKITPDEEKVPEAASESVDEDKQQARVLVKKTPGIECVPLIKDIVKFVSKIAKHESTCGDCKKKLSGLCDGAKELIV